jgi:hypothetical protein
MKLKTLKPLYLGGKTLVEGSSFVTNEQHGRELLQKGYVEKDSGDSEAAVDLSEETLPPAPVTSTTQTPEAKPKAATKKKAD